MNSDNLGNFFNADDFGDEEENEESWKPIKVHGNALFRKAVDILNLTQSLCDVLPENDQVWSTAGLFQDQITVKQSTFLELPSLDIKISNVGIV